MHSNVMHRFMVQEFQDPMLCSSTKKNNLKKQGLKEDLQKNVGSYNISESLVTIFGVKNI
jgi:hypothetical protein